MENIAHLMRKTSLKYFHSFTTDPAESCPSILVHTSVPFGLAHLDSEIEDVEGIIYKHFQELFPNLPPPTSTRCLRWRYSQVYKSYPGQPGAAVVSTNPLLILAGDGFVHSNFSGCVESANATVGKLKEHLGFNTSLK
jgi:renalase